MCGDASVSKFNVCLRDIVNNSFALSDKMLDEKLVRKLPRSLPNRFGMKVTYWGSTKYYMMKYDELMGSLLIFEMTIDDKSEKKSKRVKVLCLYLILSNKECMPYHWDYDSCFINRLFSMELCAWRYGANTVFVEPMILIFFLPSWCFDNDNVDAYRSRLWDLFNSIDVD